MDNNSNLGSASMPELEGVLVEEEGVQYPLPNAPMIDLSGPPLLEKPSSQNTFFVVPAPSGAGPNQFHPDETVAPIFGPNAPSWETALGQDISQFGTTTTINVSDMELNTKSRRHFPYLLPSELLGRSLNIPSSVVPANPPSPPTVSRIDTPSRVP